MILDTSAILAVLFDEPEREAYVELIVAQPVVGVGAPTLAETSIVLASVPRLNLVDGSRGAGSGQRTSSR